MLQFIEKKSELNSDNLVVFIEKKSDLSILENYKVSDEMLKKCKEGVKNDKNFCYEFFLWSVKIEKLYVMFYSKKSEVTVIDFFWEHFPKLDNSLVLSTESDKYIIDFVDTAILSRYEFDKYKEKKSEKKLSFLWTDSQKEEILERLPTLENIYLARDLGNTPACDLTPENFANIIKKTKWKNTKVRILSPKDIEKKWLGLLYGVWKWSANKPYMAILERIVDKKSETYGFVGKWIVFDTGWLDIKTQMMYEMKDDMCGASQTFCIMKELDRVKDLSVNVIAAIPLAENSVSSTSYRPSDILTSYSGKTVNITNTDAEWRLIMADAVSYLSKNYEIQHMSTIATLTWVALFALWFRYAAVMWTNKKFISHMVKQSHNAPEKYCEFPFDQYYLDECKSTIADFDNHSKWPYCGSIMGWAFMANFLENNESYTHFDIAWVANNTYKPFWRNPITSTGIWVESISQYIKSL